MSLEYYLFCREKYQYIVKYLESIDELYDDIINTTFDSNIIENENYYNFFLSQRNNNSLAEMKENIILLKNICDEKISELCHHEFIDDTIDITPDRSENITYCKICGFTK